MTSDVEGLEPMGLHTQEWALVWLNCVLFAFGGWLLSRGPRPDAPQVRWSAAALMCGTLGMVLDSLPRLLGSPHDLVLTLDTVAFAPIAASLVIAIRACRIGMRRS